MENFMKRKWYDCLFFCFSLFFLLLPCQADGLSRGKPVANVNGMELVEYNLQVSLNEIMPAGVFHGGFSNTKREKYRSRAIEKMINKELLYQETLKRGMKPDSEAVDKIRGNLIRKTGGYKQYEQLLKKNGLTDSQYLRTLKKKELSKKILMIEVEDKAKVTDGEASEYYKKNKEKFMRPKSIRLRHILISVNPAAPVSEKNKQKDKAEKLYARIKAGEDMAALASENSQDRYRIKGGDYGYIHLGRLDPDLEKHIVTLKTNILSKVIETRFGYHIARIEDIRPPSQLSFEQVSGKIKKQLSEARKKDLEKALISDLRENAEITIY